MKYNYLLYLGCTITGLFIHSCLILADKTFAPTPAFLMGWLTVGLVLSLTNISFIFKHMSNYCWNNLDYIPIIMLSVVTTIIWPVSFIAISLGSLFWTWQKELNDHY